MPDCNCDDCRWRLGERLNRFWDWHDEEPGTWFTMFIILLILLAAAALGELL